jgi:hypothetical protein
MKSCPIPPLPPYDEKWAFPGMNSHGMTLRDYFAAQVMGGAMGAAYNQHAWPWNEDDPKAAIAKAAYGIADAMLAARTTETIAR